MKHSASKLGAVLSAIFALCLGLATTAKAQGLPMPSDSIEVSLLTCAPHEEIYSLYGHTALRVNDMRQGGEDLVFSYGVFNFNKPHFALRFTLGKTDYELGVSSYKGFHREYSREGRSVVEQVLNLTTDEKQMLMYLLWVNSRPENRVYRYNFFYDNCTTRARDMVERSIAGRVTYSEKSLDYTPTYRKLLHQQLQGHRWAALGDDLCLGVKSDIAIDLRQQQFLPGHLMEAFATATIEANGQQRPLVKATRTLVPNRTAPSQDYPIKPIHCALALLALTVIATLAEKKHKMAAKTLDVALLTVLGLAGIVITLLLFSEHPTTNTNLQAIIINPLPLLFLPSVIRGGKVFWKLLLALVALFLIGSLFQDYAEGMEIVALCLLIRCCANLQTAIRGMHKRLTSSNEA